MHAPRECLGGSIAQGNVTYPSHLEPRARGQQRKKVCWAAKGRLQSRQKNALDIQAVAAEAVVRWRARSPPELLSRVGTSSAGAAAALKGFLCSPRELPPFQLQGRVFGRALGQTAQLQALLKFLKDILVFLTQPLGGHPVGVLEGVPGWHMKLVRGPRRWLGLRPGRELPIADAGPWWTPSGVLHFCQSVPTGVWLALVAWLGFKIVQTVQTRVQERRRWQKRQALISEAKASDLLLQRNRMLRAFEGALEVEAEEVEEEEPASAPDPQWQDPTEWDPATKRQWDNFMRKSKALRIQRDRWWDIDTADDTPHYKAAHDKLQSAGDLSSFE